MSQKTVKRILFGLLGVLVLWTAAENFLAAGVEMRTFLYGGLGLTLCYMAATGAG